jgi:hypothetical protein
LWYISRDNQRFGPFSKEEFRRFEREGQFAPTDSVWHAGLDDWVAYGNYRASSLDARHNATKCALCLLLRRAFRAPADMLATAFAIICLAKSGARARRSRNSIRLSMPDSFCAL